MDILYIKSTDDSPGIILDKEKQHFEISGQSLPEDAWAFFNPVMEWLQEYINEPLPKTILDVKLTYFNTASSKVLLDIFILLEEMSGKGNNVLVNWHYPEYDEEMKEAGIEYSEMVELEFGLIPSKSV